MSVNALIYLCFIPRRSPDAPAEAPVVEFETVRRLKCFISGEVNFMVEGIKLALKEEITKRYV